MRTTLRQTYCPRTSVLFLASHCTSRVLGTLCDFLLHCCYLREPASTAAPTSLTLPTSPLHGSLLASKLIDLVGCGDLHVSQAQTIASAAVHDGLRCPILNKLSNVGTKGRHRGNAERDFHRAFLQPTMDSIGFQLCPWNVDIPLVKEDGRGVQSQQVEFLAPHETFAALYGQGEHMFEKMVLGRGMQCLDEFWAGVLEARVPWALQHPALQDPHQRCFAVPIFIHADEAEVYNSESMYVFSWSSLAHGNPLCTKHLIGCIRSKRMVIRGKQNTTLQAVFRFIAWSLNQMVLGVWPGVVPDWLGQQLTPRRLALAGQRLAGKLSGAFAGVKGDQHFFVDAFRFKRHGCIAVCRQCHASKRMGPMVWTDVGSSGRQRRCRQILLACALVSMSMSVSQSC